VGLTCPCSKEYHKQAYLRFYKVVKVSLVDNQYTIGKSGEISLMISKKKPVVLSQDQPCWCESLRAKSNMHVIVLVHLVIVT
jgi:hypothetical protein